MKDADAGVRCELGESRGIAFSLIQQTTDALHEIDLRIEDARAFWLAAEARTKACLFRSFRQVEEPDAFAMCATRRARRPTVNASRADGENELSVEVCVFGDDGLPQLIVIQHIRILCVPTSRIYLVLALKSSHRLRRFCHHESMCLNACTRGFGFPVTTK